VGGDLSDFRELRYPFFSLAEFVSGRYWVEPASWHITAGAMLYLVLVAWVYARTRNVLNTFLVLALTTPVFNNFAYEVADLDPSQWAGLLAAVLFGLTCVKQPRIRVPVITVVLLVFWSVATVHAALVALVSPELAVYIPNRSVVLGKIAVLALVLLAFFNRAETTLVRTLLGAQVGVCLAACVIYWFQVAVFLSGTLPYGTYWDAGFTGVPSFGSVSLERGHLGKFLIPTLPLLLLYSLETGKRWPLVAVIGTSLINFSASALTFLVGYAVIYGFLWRHRLMELRRWISISIGAVLVVPVVVYFSAAYVGVIDKIVNFDRAGRGRVFSLVFDYLAAYPFGTSYGGSTLRVVPGLPEINMGVYVWLTQFTFLAIPLVMLLMWGQIRTWYSSRDWLTGSKRRILFGGMLMVWVIGAIDVLWFMPTLWLLPVLCAVLAGSARAAWKSAQPGTALIEPSRRPVV
jgi:hypothetical protein